MVQDRRCHVLLLCQDADTRGRPAVWWVGTEEEGTFVDGVGCHGVDKGLGRRACWLSWC